MMFMGFFWILLLVAIVFLIGKLFFNSSNQSFNKETPLEIFQKEYVKGNISEEDYLERKKHLQ